jgi:hypothetical protein
MSQITSYPHKQYKRATITVDICFMIVSYPPGLKSDEVTGGWRKLHNVELRYAPPIIIRMMKSRRKRWAGM